MTDQTDIGDLLTRTYRIAHAVGVEPMRVLVVDDDEGTLKLIEAILKREKQEFITDLVDNAHEAETKLRKNKYDLVIMDEVLRDGRGCDIVEKLIRDGIKLPWILISGVVGDDERGNLERKARSLLAQGVLWKDGAGWRWLQLPTIIRMAVHQFRQHFGNLPPLCKHAKSAIMASIANFLHL